MAAVRSLGDSGGGAATNAAASVATGASVGAMPGALADASVGAMPGALADASVGNSAGASVGAPVGTPVGAGQMIGTGRMVLHAASRTDCVAGRPRRWPARNFSRLPLPAASDAGARAADCPSGGKLSGVAH